MNDTDFLYFDPSRSIGHLSGNLPHWRQEGVQYFVTFRLADSIPKSKLIQWQEERRDWLRDNPEPRTKAQEQEYGQLFSARFQQWLDAGHGECLLGKDPIADLMRNVLRHFDEERYVLGEYVIMPNHVHAVVSPLPGFDLSSIVHSWKSYSSTKINAMTGCSGTLWQRESFDHIVRSTEQLNRINTYIRDNPTGKK